MCTDRHNLEQRIGLLEEIVVSLLHDRYFFEYQIIDGINRHPSGLSFDDWVKRRYSKLDNVS